MIQKGKKRRSWRDISYMLLDILTVFTGRPH